MADLNQASWSQTDASNNSGSPAGWPEGMAPSGVNDSARAGMGAVKRWHDQITPTLTSTGSANTQLLTYAVAPTAYVGGDVFSFFAGFTNSGPASLNVNGLGAKQIVTADGVALSGGEIRVGYVVTVFYDGTSMRLAHQHKQFLAASFGYLALPGGLLLQWGQTTFGAQTAVLVTFNIPFGGLYQVQTSLVQGSGDGFIAGVSATSASGFTFSTNSSYTGTGYWFAIGTI